VPRPSKQHSHYLQLFNCIQITLNPKTNDVNRFKVFLERLEALKLPKVAYYIELVDLDDTNSDGESYLKAVIKQLPHLDKLVIVKCLLHSFSFMEITRGLKLLIIKDSHVKFHPFSPGDLQQILIKNSIVLPSKTLKEDDFKSCKTFALEDCSLNYNTLIE